VKAPFGDQTFGQMAEAFVFVAENLTIGKVAPDQEAIDENGVKFKVSDYRGKVVVLDFWGYW
jgi:cytochrome oxidase Cu insertion factor (SCO1/SenC/PrrC family)